MRFFAGVIVGIVIGRPVANLVNEHLTPSVRRKITEGVNKVADYLNSQIEREESQ